MRRAPGLLLSVLLSSGCASAPPRPQRPADVNHIVLFKLTDPAFAGALIADNERLLAGIPGVRSMFCGRHLDVGRDTIDADYHVALYLGFDTVDDYLAYVDHPNHRELVRLWRPRFEWIRVHDVLAEAP